MKRLLPLLLLTGTLLMSCHTQSRFVTVRDGQFYTDGKPYRYIGTNLWYGGILGSEGQGGNRQRLCEELDELCRLGVTNLRVLVGGEGLSELPKEGCTWSDIAYWRNY